MSVRVTVVCLAVLVWAIGASAPASAAPVFCLAATGATSCTPPLSASVTVGDNFDVDLLIQDAEGLGGWAVVPISFDPAVLTVVSVSEGSFLRENGFGCSPTCETHFAFLLNNPNPLGQISQIVGYFWGVDIGSLAWGTGALATIRFRAIGAAPLGSSINIGTTFWSNNMSPLTVSPGTVTVASSVPEPGVLALIGLGLTVALGARRRRARSRAASLPRASR